MSSNPVVDAFAGIFVIGVVLTVYVVIRGVERRGPAKAFAKRHVRIALRSPFVATFMLGFGLGGYLFSRAGFSFRSTLWIASPLALILASLAVSVVRHWARRGAEASADEAEGTLQGQFGIVVRDATGEGPAEVEYWLDNRRVVRRAKAVAGVLRVGMEVVIERVDGNVVYVEAWSRVEQRI